MHAANVVGTDNVLAAVRAAGVPRLVHTSSVVAIGLSADGAPCTEASPWNFDTFGLDDGYAITKRESEQRVRAAAAADVDAVIVNPTYMFGPRDARPSSGKLIVDLVRRKVPGWTPGFNNFVDVRDVARGMVRAWKQGVRGERYILGGHEMTYRDVMYKVAEVAGVKPPRFRVPHTVAKVVGRFGDLGERLRDKDPLITSTTVRYAYTDRFRFSSARAQAELGYTYGPVEPAIADAITWLRGAGMLPAA
jgi:dihydroflavonol-4-reductase